MLKLEKILSKIGTYKSITCDKKFKEINLMVFDVKSHGRNNNNDNKNRKKKKFKMHYVKWNGWINFKCVPTS